MANFKLVYNENTLKRIKDSPLESMKLISKAAVIEMTALAPSRKSPVDATRAALRAQNPGGQYGPLKQNIRSRFGKNVYYVWMPFYAHFLEYLPKTRERKTKTGMSRGKMRRRLFVRKALRIVAGKLDQIIGL